ncbi:5'-nucleotidase C-terminal domain-containing protein [Aquimarina sp. W85]|uniref:5'-nucleotidase C-terminal domain-containing protein n=1 Tax=Aquimarina rhodophyticola TaxID=3342246 RepID=UPI00366C86D5
MKYLFYVGLLALICFSCQHNNVVVTKVHGIQHTVDSSYVSAIAIDSFIRPYRRHLNETLDAPLSFAKTDITKLDGTLESSLGNLIADLSLDQVQPLFQKRYRDTIDLVLLNHGGLRAPILKGNVTARNAYEVMPFENELVVVQLDYTGFMQLVQYIINNEKAHPTSNLRLVYDQKTKKIVELLVHNKLPTEDKKYYVLTSDYLKDGGDNMQFFKEADTFFSTDYKLRNALIDYFTKKDTLTTVLDKRIQYAE